MKTTIALFFAVLLTSALLFAQQVKVEEATIKVFGNCNQCKDRIEDALEIKEVKFAKWDKHSKQLKLAYESIISLDSLKKRIAAVGHDVEGYDAPDSVYANLPGCCLYRDKAHTH